VGNWSDEIVRGLGLLADRLEESGLWYALIYGSLLGAVRESDVIEWDYDFDILMRPEDVPLLFSMKERLARDDLNLWESRLTADRMPVNPGNVAESYIQSIGVDLDGEKVGDIYVFQLFNDGILRRYDTDKACSWWPHSSFPAWFVEGRESATLRGRSYPVPRAPKKLIEGIYGEDWQTPYKAPSQGGEYREGRSYHGDLFSPKLEREIAWCEAQGWDRAKYRAELPWPQPIRGAGPYGFTERSKDTTQAYWWKSLTELVRYY